MKCSKIVPNGYFDFGPCNKEGVIKLGKKTFCMECAQNELSRYRILTKKARRVIRRAFRKERILSREMAKQSIPWYDKNGASFEQQTMELDMGEFYRPFLSLIRPGGKIIDAGCGPGRDTLAFIRKGFNVVAFDGSEEMAKIASKNTGINVQCCRFDEFDGSKLGADGIWACASLLHVPHNDLAHTVKRLADSLSSFGGVVFLSFKYGKGEKHENGRWFFFHDEQSISNVAKEIKLPVVKMWKTMDIRKNGTEWLNVLLSRSLWP